MSNQIRTVLSQVTRFLVALGLAISLLGNQLPVEMAMAAGHAALRDPQAIELAHKAPAADVAAQVYTGPQAPAPLPGWVSGPIPQVAPTETVTATATVSITEVIPSETPTATVGADRPTPTATDMVTPTVTTEAQVTSTTTPTATETTTPTDTVTPTATETATPTPTESLTTDLKPVESDALIAEDVKQEGPSLLDLVPAGVPVVISKDSAVRSAVAVDVVDSVTLPGGAAASILMNGRMLVVVEDKALEAGATLSVKPTLLQGTSVFYDRGAPSAEALKAESRDAGWLDGGEILAFEIEAIGADGKSPITKFEQAVQIYVDLRGLDIQFPTDNYIFLYHDPADPKNPTPIAAQVVERTGLVGFSTQHFSQYSLLSNNGPWKFNWNPATVSEFSGAATYSYPIEVPPGVNGLQPSLSVSYSSRSVDGQTRSNSDQGVLGMGWSMSEIAVIRDGVVPKWEYQNLHVHYYDAFSLSLNGAGHEMVRSNNNVLQMSGNNTWNATINRVQGITQTVMTQGVTLRFKPDSVASGEQFVLALRTSANYRLAIHGRNGQMNLQYNSGSGFIDSGCSFGTLYANSYSVATFSLTADGKYWIEVYNEAFPHATRAICSNTMASLGLATNLTWNFYAWTYAGKLFLDDYTDSLSMRDAVDADKTEEFEDTPNAAYWAIPNSGTGGGQAGVVDDPTSRRFALQDDPSVFVQQVWQQGSLSSAMNSDHIFWLVKTGTGITYLLGYGEDAENYADGMPAIDNHDGMFTGDNWFRTGVRWNVSFAIDSYGNRVNYIYAETTRHSDFACPDPANSYPTCYTQGFNTQMSRVDHIDYNFNGSGVPQTVVAFVPYTESDGSPQRRVQEIVMAHNGTTIRRIKFGLGQSWYNYTGGCVPTWTQRVDSIQEWNGANNESLPATTLTYVDKSHGPCNSWAYVDTVHNGYGGRVHFTYTEDGQGAGSVGTSYYVTQKDVYASPSGPAATTEYGYQLSDACWAQGGGAMQPAGALADCGGSYLYDLPHWVDDGPLVGFGAVNIQHRSFSGTVLDITRYTFWRREAGSGLPDAWAHLMVGKPKSITVQNAAGTPQSYTSTTYAVESVDTAYFIRKDSDLSRTYRPDGQYWMEYSTQYEYLSGLQGGAQYGNVTLTKQTDEGSTTGIYRSTRQGYYPNPAKWIVSQPAYVYNYAGNQATLTGAVSYSYDNAPDSRGPSFGKGVRTAERVWVNNTCSPSNCQLRDTVYGYDGWGNPETVKTFTSYGSFYAYASSGPRTTTTTYDAAFHIYPTSVTNADGTTTGQWDYANSVLSWVQGPNGAMTQVFYEYDTFARLTKVIKPGDSSGLPTIKYTYDTAGLASGNPFRVQTDVREYANNSNVLTSQTYTDGLGREILTTSEYLNDNSASAVFTVFDALNRAASVSKPVQMSGLTPAYTSTYPAGIVWTTTTYDALGRATQVLQPDGNTSTTAYSVSTAQSVKHLETSSTDSLGNLSRSFTDVYGRTHIVQQNSGNAILTGGSHAWLSDTGYNYNTLDQLVGIVNNNGTETTQIDYNFLGQKWRMIDPDMGTWTYGYNVGTGTMLSQTDALGQTLWFQYDGLDRMTQKCTSQACTTGSVLASYTYGTAAPNVGYRTAMSAPQTGNNSSATWSYDSRGRVVTETKTIDGRTFTYNYTYDSADRVATITSPNSETVTQVYNSTGQLAAASTSLGGLYFQALTYDVAGRMTSILSGNNLTTSQSYYGWNETVTHTPSGLAMGQNGGLKTLVTGASGNVQKFQYQYLANGNIWKLEDQGHGGQAAQTQTFTYDSLNRLTNAVVSPSNAAGYYSQAYSYTVNGNLIQSIGTLSGTVNGTLVYGTLAPSCPAGAQATPKHGANSVSGQESANYWCYDANGNMVFRSENSDVYTQTYNVENRLSQVAVKDWANRPITTTFTYDADGTRIKELRPDNSYTLFVGDKFEVECTPPTAPTITGPVTTINAGTTAITWSAVSGASSYKLRVLNVNTNALTEVNGLTTTSYSFNFVADTTYKIKVYSVNACGADSSGTSALYIVVVNAAGTTPTATWTQIPTLTVTPTATRTATATATRTATRTNTPSGPTSTATRTATKTSTPTSTATSSGSTCSVLDNFNRANGGLGSGWNGQTGSYAIASNQFDVTATGDAGRVIWNAGSYGATQQVCVKLTAIDTGANSEIILILKNQSSNDISSGFMTVTYKPASSLIRVETYDSSAGWVQYGADLTGVSFAVNDVLRVVARSTGSVEVYKNTTLLGTRDASAWTYAASTGYIGLWLYTSPATLLDDFGGGTYSGAAGSSEQAEAPRRAAKALYVRVPEPRLAAERAGEAIAAIQAWTLRWTLGSHTVARPNGDSMRALLAPVAKATALAPNTDEVFRVYYMAGARPVAVRTVLSSGSSSVQYLHPDHLGSIGQITNAGGSLIQDNYFKPYGGVRWSASGVLGPDTDTTTRRSYTGQYEETNKWMGSLMDYKARYYSPYLNRFVSPDVLVPAPTNPQALNRYSYVLNNPARLVDPSGHCFTGTIDTAICIIAFVGIALFFSQIPSDSSTMVQKGVQEPGNGLVMLAGVLMVAPHIVVSAGATVCSSNPQGCAQQASQVAANANRACGGDMCAGELQQACTGDCSDEATSAANAVQQSGQAIQQSIRFVQSQLNHMYSRHAKDFGFLESWSKATAAKFQQAILDHIGDSGTQAISGTFRGTIKVTHYFNPTTGLNVMVDLQNNVISGWKLSPDQIKYLFQNGNIQ